MLLTCSHEPEVDSTLGDEEGARKDTGWTGDKWKGLKNETITYKSFLPLWKSLMVPEKVASIKIGGKIFSL